MLITVKGYTKAVHFVEEGKSYTRFSVGLANVKLSKTGSQPYVWIPGMKYPEFKRHVPLILGFVYEYKRLVSQPGTPAPISIVDATPDSRYQYRKASPNKNYVSSVPQWITELKEWKVCSGPYRTYKRRVRLPQEHVEQVELYMPYCCQCEYRADCAQPCMSPDICSKEELQVG